MKVAEKEITLKNGQKCMLKSPEPKDAERMIDYMRVTSEETHFMARYPEEIKLTLEQEEEFIRNMQESEHDFMVGAYINGILVGNLGLSAINNYIKMQHRAEVGISIIKKYWGLGIGTSLFDAAIKQATELGYEQLELGVFSDNSRAQALYGKLGFEKWGSVKHAYRLKDGTYRDEIMMGKIL